MPDNRKVLLPAFAAPEKVLHLCHLTVALRNGGIHQSTRILKLQSMVARTRPLILACVFFWNERLKIDKLRQDASVIPLPYL